ncbi:hypothetical protein KO488_06255 [Poseidonibacter lekithochrous]|uniref:type II restriction enzyme n=1 Tax=Poseidonibacter TaxID=2321187 RepID=UPI001C0A4AEF|nr:MULTISPECIES: hypothetical protein [Poseidonibacter]MBU3014353.1 hypothetical protein [Poseidonibacter lekithochrous]MDO6827651.1 hypothetical protein [Poseidonibacter sp. 1_MG-2023]
MSKITSHTSWENIFNQYNVLSEISRNNYFDITADQIKAVDGKEARLMTKVDFRQSLPNIMKQEELSILAIKNGLYRIAKNDPFININQNIETEIIELEAPSNIISIDPYNIKSESAALDIATITEMANTVFGEESSLSIRGRLRGSLNFNIGTVPYNIDGVQIEVDGGYEGNSSINLIEAKIGYRDNINIRQLLYPELYWKNEISNRKTIKSYIFYLQEDIYRFIPYIYDGVIGYADHANEKAFKFKEPSSDFSLFSIEINENHICLNTPFPQADKFDTIHSMLILISEHPCMTKEELKLNFDIVDRQIDYYYNVLKWLKLCEEENDCMVLTTKGIEVLQLPFKDRIIEISKIVFSEPIFNNYLNDREVNLQLFQRYNVNSESTKNRRLQTVKAWVLYFKNIVEN